MVKLLAISGADLSISTGCYLWTIEVWGTNVVSQTRAFGGNRNHDPHANSLTHYPPDYQGTLSNFNCW